MEMTENRVGSAAYRQESAALRKRVGRAAETDFSALLQDARGRLRTDDALPVPKREPEDWRADGRGSAEKSAGNAEIHTEKKERTEKDEKAEEQTVQNEAVPFGIVPLLLFAQKTLPEGERAAELPAGISDALPQDAPKPAVIRNADVWNDSTLSEVASEEAPVTKRTEGATLPLPAMQTAEAAEEDRTELSEEALPEYAEDAGSRGYQSRAEGAQPRAVSPEREAAQEPVIGEAPRSGSTMRTERRAGESGNAAVFPHGMTVRQERGGEHIPAENVPRDTLPTTAAALPASLSDRIASQLRNRLGGELLIQLEPRNLGQILLRVSYTGAQARVSLYTDDARTMELLSRNAQEMAQIITEKTGTVTAVLIPERQAEAEMQNSGNNSDNRDRAAEELERRIRERTQESGDFLQQLRLGLV